MASMLQNMTRLGILPQYEPSSTQGNKQSRAISNPSNTSAQVAPDQAIPALYASTSLKTLLRTVKNPATGDVTHDGQTYRKVDPMFWAWLKTRMEKAEAAHKAGKLSQSQWDALRTGFNQVQAYALETYGKDALRQALKEIKHTQYRPPITTVPEEAHITPEPEWKYPPHGEYKAFESVTLQAVRQVESIKDKALAHGWSMAGLFQNRGNFTFPIGQDWGLVCFLQDDRQIAGITENFIEIIHAERNGRTNTLKFQNPDRMRGNIKPSNA